MPSRAGSTNRNKSFLLNRLKDMYGDDFHPILKMAGNAVKIQEAIDDQNNPAIEDLVRSNHAWDQIAQYTEPKLKAIEISGDPDNPLEIVHNELTSTERAARIAAILDSGRERRDRQPSDSGGAKVDASTGSADSSCND